MKPTSRYIPDKVKRQILDRQNDRCANEPGSNLFRILGFPCLLWEGGRDGVFIGSCYEFDHVVEFSLTRDNSIGNLQCLCSSCHSLKTKDFQSEMSLARKKGVIEDYKTLKKKPMKSIADCSSDTESASSASHDDEINSSSHENSCDDTNGCETNIFNDLLKHRIMYENIIIPVIFDENYKSWYGAKEVTLALNYTDTKAAAQDAIRKNVFLRHRKEFHKFNFDNRDFHQRKLFIAEAGLHRIMLRRRKFEGIKFSVWMVDVLPSIRNFRYHKLSKKYEQKYAHIAQKITFLEDENEDLKSRTRQKSSHDMGSVYVIDRSNKNETLHQIGWTTDTKLQQKMRDTHTLHKETVVYFQETDGLQLESCVQLLLYDYKYKKDLYRCSFKTVIRAFKKCNDYFAKTENQQGGYKPLLISDLVIAAREEQMIIQNKIARLDDKFVGLDKQIKLEQKTLKAQINRKKTKQAKTRSNRAIAK